MIPDIALPIIFAVLMAVAILLYAILDGYDLGVGILLPMDNAGQRDSMIASIGPFWDANETWLVMAVGLLLIAFPTAHSVILGELYLPILALLIGLILRGVAFDFRAKVKQGRKYYWDHAFKWGSLLAAAAQGYMLGAYVMGFESTWQAYLFSLLSAAGVVAAYVLIGACWLVMKTEAALQQRALSWAKRGLIYAGLGIVAVCIINPLVNPVILDKWLSKQGLMLLGLIPPLTAVCFWYLAVLLKRQQTLVSEHCYKPFTLVLLVFVLCFAGLAYSFYPYVVPGQLDIYQSASAPESLRFILYGALVVMPLILAYTFFVYRVFRGKVSELTYY